MKVILASNSPRRKEILENLGVEFEVFAPETDETSDIDDPAALVQELALRKSEAARAAYSDKAGEKTENNECLIFISADTIVFSPENGIFGKPRDEEDARRMLRAFQGGSIPFTPAFMLPAGKKQPQATKRQGCFLRICQTRTLISI